MIKPVVSSATMSFKLRRLETSDLTIYRDPTRQPHLPLVPFMESLYVEGLDLKRGADQGRDVDL